MNLYLLRHGIAVELGAAGVETDRERPLTPEGKRKIARIARAMQAMDLAFDLILFSPFVRARQTAEVVARVLRAKKYLTLSTHLTPEGDPRRLVVELRRRDPAPQDVLFVGHEPYLSGLVAMLVAGRGDLTVTLKKGGLCKLSADSLKFGRCASLEWLLTPKHMSLFALKP